MMKIGHAALVAVLGLSGCATDFFPEQDHRIDLVPLTDDSRESLDGYFLLRDAKAFVFDPASGRGLYGSGYDTIAGAEDETLARCQSLIGAACTTFALNNQIVWQPDVANLEPEPVSPPYRSTTTAVNIRIGPGTNFEVIDVIKAGETVEVTGVAGIWQSVRRVDGSIGYVHGDYLGEIEPAAGPTDEDAS